MRAVLRGVFCDAGATRTPFVDLRAACVATNGIASHASAAWVWGLLAHPPDRAEVSVVTGSNDPRCSRITVHRSIDLEGASISERSGIPVTNPLRTLVDLAGVALPGQLTEAVDGALARQLVTTAGLEAEIGRLARRGRPGVAVLRRHLVERGFIGAPEPSVLEAHLRRLIRRLGLPPPDVEVRAGDHGEYRLDVTWRSIRYALEVDGYRWHFSPEQKGRDDARRNALRDVGWTLRVYTWWHVVRRPLPTGREIIATHRRLSRPG